MPRNLGTADRMLRALVVAPALAIVALLVGVGSVAGVVLLVLAGVMLVTGLAGSCPLYRLVGMNTCPRKTAGA